MRWEEVGGVLDGSLGWGGTLIERPISVSASESDGRTIELTLIKGLIERADERPDGRTTRLKLYHMLKDQISNKCSSERNPLSVISSPSDSVRSLYPSLSPHPLTLPLPFPSPTEVRRRLNALLKPKYSFLSVE